MSAAPPPEPTRVRNPGCILPLVATVGFAGHRKLDGPEAVGESIALAFEAIANGVGEMAKRKLGQGPETVASAYGGPTTLRLLTGDASGPTAWPSRPGAPAAWARSTPSIRTAIPSPAAP